MERQGGTAWGRALPRVAVMVIAGLSLAACLPPSPPASIPFAGVPTVAPYPGTECLKVLVIGDSLANQLARGLEAAYEATGRCADVDNRAVSGTAVVDWAPGASLDPAAIYDEVQPDFVVTQFLGNASAATGLTWSDPAWLDTTTTAALAIADAAIAEGLDLYWALPPKSAWSCDWSHESATAFQALHTWIRSTLWTTRAVHPLDLRTPLGGETFSRWFQFPDGVVTDLRQSDCVHFSTTGESVVSGLTVANSFDEWGVSAPPPEEPTTTTTTTTAPAVLEPTTTSTSAPEALPDD